MNGTNDTEIRDRILLATLPHVAFDGWVKRSIELGAADAGCGPEVVRRVFPGGADEMIRYWSDSSDQRMIAAMEKLNLEQMRMRDRIATAVRKRIEFNAPYREAVRRTLSYLSLPPNSAIALRNLCNTVNAVWYAAGDTSTDFSFYTKRALLAPVYASTVLYWLDDESEGFEDTWSFLDRRLDDVLQIPRIQGRLLGTLERLVFPFKRRNSGSGPRARARQQAQASTAPAGLR